MSKNYKVRISRRNRSPFNINDIKGEMRHTMSSRWVGLGYDGKWIGIGINDLYKDGVIAELYYVTAQEDLAMEVYANAKRNLDPKKYMVTLELPGKEMQ